MSKHWHCPYCGKRVLMRWSFWPWCSAGHWAKPDNNTWQQGHGISDDAIAAGHHKRDPEA